MSVPPNLHLEPEVHRGEVGAAAGALAALIGDPPPGVTRRGSVLLVPGYTGSKEDFLPVLAPLARRGYLAVTVDLRGQYESTGPDDPAAYTLDALAKDVTSAGDELAGPVHLVGHSFGGLVTRRAVINGFRPRSLALVGSGPAALTGHRADVTRAMFAVLDDAGLTAIADAAQAMHHDDPRMATVAPDVPAFLRTRWLTASPTGLRVMGEELINAVDEVDALRATGVPVLVLHGEHDDAWTPAAQHEMADRLGATYSVIGGAMHSPACEAPAATVDALLTYWAGLT